MTGLGMAVVALTLVFIPGKGEKREGSACGRWFCWGYWAACRPRQVQRRPGAAGAGAGSFFWYRIYGSGTGTCAAGGRGGGGLCGCHPYIWQDSETFWRDFEYELNHSRLGHPGSRPPGLGVPPGHHPAAGLRLAGAGPGGGWYGLAAGDARPARAEKLGLLAFPLAELWVVGGSHLAFQRYALPLLPLVAILAALGLHAFIRAVSQRFPRLGLAAALLAGVALAAAVLPNAAHAVRSDELLAGADTRESWT